MKAPPKPTATGKVKNIDLSGMLFLWTDGQPVLVRIVGDERWCLPVFSTKQILDAAVRDLGLVHEGIKQIEDARDFLDSVPPTILILADVRKHGDRVRYMLVKHEGN